MRNQCSHQVLLTIAFVLGIVTYMVVEKGMGDCDSQMGLGTN